MVAGAWMGGMRGIVMMQTSGFALIANALASDRTVANTDHHGGVRSAAPSGKFQIGQALVAHHVTVLDTRHAHHTLTDEAT